MMAANSTEKEQQNPSQIRPNAQNDKRVSLQEAAENWAYAFHLNAICKFFFNS